MLSWSRRLSFPKGSIHLDVGAGEGILSYLVASCGYHSIAVDLSATILHSATLFKSEIDDGANASEARSMELWVADIYDLPLESGSVDFVTIKQVLHHLDDLDGLMQELSRVLKPDGVVYLLWEPFFMSIPLLRQRYVSANRPRELAMGIHHIYHTYWTYDRLFRRWLVDPVIEREFEVSKPQHHVTRNRFTSGSVSIHGRFKPHVERRRKPNERRQIQPEDFLCEKFIPEGLRTTRRRKEFLDALLAEAAVERGAVHPDLV
jgi:ubiquinone/menaquinone biosynthesis C-methylase UbiE